MNLYRVEITDKNYGDHYYHTSNGSPSTAESSALKKHDAYVQSEYGSDDSRPYITSITLVEKDWE